MGGHVRGSDDLAPPEPEQEQSPHHQRGEDLQGVQPQGEGGGVIPLASESHEGEARSQLEKRGHRALTVDLPIADPTAGVDEYVAAVADVLAGAGDDPILVAHSLSGLIAPVVADILFFVPWGALAFLSIDGANRSRRSVYAVTVLLGVAFALGLTAWQIMLPTRVTSVIDCLWNGVGCALGAALGHARKQVRVRFE